MEGRDQKHRGCREFIKLFEEEGTAIVRSNAVWKWETKKKTEEIEKEA
jgi:hypothetical protein